MQPGRHCRRSSCRTKCNPTSSHFDTAKSWGVSALAVGGGATAIFTAVDNVIQKMHPLHLKWALVEDTNAKVSQLVSETATVTSMLNNIEESLAEQKASLAKVLKEMRL